jgi:two-component system cell cycle sensor histidine kinase/response regulator CckA
MKYKRVTLQATVACLIAFCAFVIVFERQALNRAQSRIEDHAVIIANDLWNYNHQGAAEYLKLAASSQHYASLVVTDHSGRVFNRTEMNNVGLVERFFIRLKLIPRVKLLAHVEHRGNIIGWIEAVWLPQTLFVHAYVFFAFLLLIAIIHLYTRVLDEKRLLGERVRERTAELLQSNTSLKQEINERIRAEEALRKSEEKHRLLAENIKDVIWTTDMNLKFTYVSPVAREMHGWSEGEKPPFNGIEDIVAPSSLDSALKVFNDNIVLSKKTGDFSRSVTVEMELLRVDGTTFWTEVTASFLVGKDLQPEGILGVTRDITDRHRALMEKEDLQRKLDRSKKMESLGLLAGGVAHDLNNVLSGIVSYPDLLLMDLPEGSPLWAPIRTIKESGQKAANIVQDLLTLARRGVVATEVVNLNGLIAEYLDSPEHKKMLTYHPAITIQTALESNLPNLQGSPIHLRKSIMNLVSNAAEAQPQGGIIKLTTQSRYLDRPIQGYDNVKEGDYVVMRIEDRGEGIAKADLHRIFEPFYTKKVMGRSGTGLGMAVVWGTVQDHQGYIDIHSTVDQGTVFELYFPMSRESLPKEESQLSVDALRGSGESILVVDDVEDQRTIATSILGKLNYTVSAVSSGEKAVEFIKDNPVNLVVLDMIMDPGIDGLETYKRILQLYPDQKAIIASGFAETDRVKEAQRLGAGEYIKKPYIMQKIGLAVKKAIAS